MANRAVLLTQTGVLRSQHLGLIDGAADHVSEHFGST
jgi:hypothetical protein